MAKRHLSWGQVLTDTVCIGAIAVLLSCRDPVAEAVRQGLVLCCQSVIPALFPMMFLSSLAVALGCGQFFSPAVTALTLGLIGGYPTGARVVGDLLRRGALERKDAQRLLCCCNNAGPAFILGLIGDRFSHPLAAWYLCLIHIATALLWASLLWPQLPRHTLFCRREHFATALVSSVRAALSAAAAVCGFVIVFLVALTLLRSFFPLTDPLWWGALELTNGILPLSDNAGGFIRAAALLSWGGLSVHCQTAAMLEGTGVRLRDYFLSKLGQSVTAALLAWSAAPLLF